MSEGSGEAARREPASRIRLLVSDIDGTLVTSEKVLTPATRAAAKRLREAGILLCLVSSRSVRGMRMFVEPLEVDTPCAGLNGGEIVDADGTLLEEVTLSPDAARLSLDMLAASGIESWLFADRDWIIRDPDGAFVPRERRAVQFEPTLVDNFEPYIGRIGKIMGASQDHPKLAHVETELQAMLGAQANAHRSSAWYLDITHPDANKGTAAMRLAELLGVDRSEVACIGDMANDVPMLRQAALSVAMGNAPEAVASVAHFVTASNEQDGWAQAVETLVLPRAPR